MPAAAAAAYAVAPGVLVESLGSTWVAFSRQSGETVLLNNEAAAVLEVLAQGPQTAHEEASSLADDGDCQPAEILPLIQQALPQLIDNGLVCPA